MLRYIVLVATLLVLSPADAKVICPVGYYCKDNGNNKAAVSATAPAVVVLGPADYCPFGNDTVMDVAQGKTYCVPSP